MKFPVSNSPMTLKSHCQMMPNHDLFAVGIICLGMHHFICTYLYIQVVPPPTNHMFLSLLYSCLMVTWVPKPAAVAECLVHPLEELVCRAELRSALTQRRGQVEQTWAFEEACLRDCQLCCLSSNCLSPFWESSVRFLLFFCLYFYSKIKEGERKDLHTWLLSG